MSFFYDPFGLGSKGFDFLTKDRGPKKVGLLDEDQQQLRKQLYGDLASGSGLAQFTQFDPEASAQRFQKAVADPLINQFNEEVLPGITGQFRQGGLANSTFAGQASGRAAEGLERQLASGLAQFQGAERQFAAQNLNNMLNQLLNQQTFGFQEQTPNLLETIITNAIAQAPQFAAAAL